MQHERDRMETVIARGIIVAMIAFVVIMHAGAIQRGSAAGGIGQILWSMQLGDSSAKLPAIGDVDGDGRKEIIYSFSSSIVCLTSSGSSKWSRSMTSPSMPVLAQADQDKALEIFVYASNSLYCLKGNGSIKWQSTIPETITNNIAIADVNKDNITEIFLSTTNNRIYCFSANNGTMKWNSTAGLNMRSPLIAGTTADGNALLIAGSTNGTLRGIASINGSVRWTTSFYNTTITPLAACDADGNGNIDVIVKTNTLACVCATNGVVKWQLSSLPGPIDNVVTGDVNHDGKMEIVASAQINSAGKIYCLSASTGILLWQSSSNYNGGLVQIADINGDHAWEICLPMVVLAGTNGSVMWTGSTSQTCNAMYTFALGDVNGDGMLEMVYSYYYYYQSGRSSYSYYYVECAQFPGKSWAQSPSWSSSAGSVLHTNAYTDEDHDNVSTSMELVIGTDPLKNDTDGDGISDGNEIVGFTNPLDIHDPGIYAPTLTSCIITPANGTQATLFNFTAIYSDRDNNTPVNVTLVLDGNRILMQKQKATNTNYLIGVSYTYSRYLSPGNHSWRVETADSRFSTQTLQKSFIVGLTNFHAPTLNLSRAERAKEFSQLPRAVFSIQYSDIDNNPPSIIMLNLDSVNYTMIKQDSTDLNYMDGCMYSCIIPITTGLHQYSYSCSDGIFTARDGPYVMNFTCLPEFQFLDYRVWGGKSTDSGYSVWGNGDAIYTCGHTASYGKGSYDLLLVKWDAAGNQVWNRTWGGTSSDYGYSVWGNGDAIYTCGCTYSFGKGNGDLFLVKWDATGNQVWNRTWGGTSSDYGYSVWGNDDAIYTCGYTQSFGKGSADLVLVKWDAAGDQVWNRTWGGTNADFGYSVWGNDDAIYTCGYTQSFGKGSYDLVLVKWDAAGNQAWNRTWGGASGDYGQAVWGNGDTIYTCGYTQSFGKGSYDLLLVKWDAAGHQVWNRTWGGTNADFGYSVWGDGDAIYTCGYTASYGKGNYDLLLVKWDPAGNIVWNSTWGGTNDDYGYSVWGNNDAIYTCGETDSYGIGSGDLLLAKWDGFYCIPVSGPTRTAPRLVNGLFDPASGFQDTLITFRVTYLDDDNSPPVYIKVSIDAVDYPMTRLDPMDYDYRDGVLFLYRTTLPEGNHTVQFKAGDGLHDVAVGMPNIVIHYGQEIWNRTWGGTSNDYGQGVWSSGDDIYTCGYTQSYGKGSYDLVLVKWDDAGNQAWNHTWGGSSDDYGYAVWGNGDAIYTCGYTQSYGKGSYDLLLVKWDAAGNQAWNRTWGGASDDYGHAVWGNGDAIYTCGYTYSFGKGSYDLLLVRWDAAGNQVWNRTWGGTNADYGNAVWCNGNDIYTCGYTQSYGKGSYDLLLVKWDAAGNQVWNRTWGGTNADYGNSLWVNGDAIYTCGYTASYGKGSYDLVLVKWDDAGYQAWNRTWGGTNADYGNSVWGNDDAIYTCGYTQSYGKGSADLVLVTWDAAGNQAWNRTWGGTNADYGNSLWGDNGAVYTCGYTNSYGKGSSDVLLIKYILFKPALLELREPVDGSTMYQGKIRFSWRLNGNITGSANYSLQISNDTAFSSSALETTNITSSLALTTVNLTVSILCGTYNWRIGITSGIYAGNFSAPNMFQLTPVTVPGAPRSLQASSGNRQVTLTWQAPSSNGGSAITGYNVYISMTSGGETLLATLGVVLTNTVTGLTNGQVHYFQVSALNAIGEGQRTAEVSAIPATVPGAPTGLTSTPGNANVMLNWVAPSNNGGSAITGYRVYLGTTPGGEFLFSLVGPVLTYTATSLTNGQVYYFQVTAVNAMGEGARSTEASATPKTVPGAPSIPSVTPGDMQIRLCWALPSDNGGFAITGYKIFCGTSAGSESLLASVGPVLAYISTGLVNGQIYYFKVAAMNAIGTGANSTEVNAIPITVPGMPTGCKATPRNKLIWLSWTTPATNGGSAILNFMVYRGITLGNEAFYKILGNVTGWTDGSVVNGQSYYYLVSAVNAAGEGVKSNETSATPFGTPGVPLNFQVKSGNKQVILSWQAPASNGGSPILSYGICRGTSPGSEMYLGITGNVTSFIDTSVMIGQLYYYSVNANNVAGEGPPSEEESATPDNATSSSNPTPQPPADIISGYLIGLVSCLLMVFGSVLTVSTYAIARKLKIKNHASTNYVPMPSSMAPQFLVRMLEIEESSFGIERESHVEAAAQRTIASVSPSNFSMLDPASPVRSIVSSIEKVRRLMQFDIAAYTEQPTVDAILGFVPNIASLFEDNDQYIDVDFTQGFTEIDEEIMNTGYLPCLLVKEDMPRGMNPSEHVLRVENADLHADTSTKDHDDFSEDHDMDDILTLMCPDCTGSIEVTDWNDTSTHVCKTCQKPMLILLDCKACFTTWWIPASNAILAKGSSVICPVCHEPIKK